VTQINLAVFASGSGTNAEEIIKYFKDHATIAVKGLLCNNPKAFAITRAKKHQLPVHVCDRKEFRNPELILGVLKKWEIDAIILAGFLWLVPEYLIDQFPNKILNIHPALLPKFGGKGMYGMNVHQAVLDADEKVSGITIHLVNQRYDDGQIIFQKKCKVENHDTPETLATKIHKLEHEFYPKVIEQWLNRNGTKY
jgi:phosphoribosylglycinamide formyltransferase-1